MHGTSFLSRVVMFRDKKMAFICSALEVIVGNTFYEGINVRFQGIQKGIYIWIHEKRGSIISIISYTAFLNKVENIIYVYVE